jgi:hypothetical protein
MLYNNILFLKDPKFPVNNIVDIAFVPMKTGEFSNISPLAIDQLE